MLSPAALLVLKRLIAILTILIRALEHTIGKRRTQNLRQAALRFLLTRLVAHLTELGDSEATPEPTTANSRSEPRQPLVTDLTLKPYPASTPTPHRDPTPTPAQAKPTPNPSPKSKPLAPTPPTHAQFITM